MRDLLIATAEVVAEMFCEVFVSIAPSKFLYFTISNLLKTPYLPQYLALQINLKLLPAILRRSLY